MTATIKKNILFVVSLVIFFGLRMDYLLSGKNAVDTYGYFERAMIQTKEQSVSLAASGVAYAYTGALSVLFRFIGNRMEAVGWYHMVLQTTAFCLLILGCCLLSGRVAAYFCAIITACFPYLIKSLLVISPENYFLFFFAFLFFMMSLFFMITRKSGRYRNNRGEIFLILIGFLAGMVCIWQEMEPWLPAYLGGVMLMSGIFGFLFKKKNEPAADVSEKEQSCEETKSDMTAKGETEERPKVNYIENPLPLPKKHEKRTMDFAVDSKEDDFDFYVDAKDDFDV